MAKSGISWTISNGNNGSYHGESNSRKRKAAGSETEVVIIYALYQHNRPGINGENVRRNEMAVVMAWRMRPSACIGWRKYPVIWLGGVAAWRLRHAAGSVAENNGRGRRGRTSGGQAYENQQQYHQTTSWAWKESWAALSVKKKEWRESWRKWHRANVVASKAANLSGVNEIFGGESVIMNEERKKKDEESEEILWRGWNGGVWRKPDIRSALYNLEKRKSRGDDNLSGFKAIMDGKRSGRADNRCQRGRLTQGWHGAYGRTFQVWTIAAAA